MPELSEAILELIVAGVYEPGEKLNEVELAGRLGVSRTPVRDALKALATTGVVTVERHKGARVAVYSPEFVEANYSARTLLEPHAARLAMDHLDADDLAELRRLAHDMHARVLDAGDAPSDVSSITAANDAFHALILHRCPHERIGEMALGLLKPAVASRTFRSYDSRERLRSALHHLEIVDALTVGDGEWVESIMRAHIRAGWHTALKAF